MGRRELNARGRRVASEAVEPPAATDRLLATTRLFADCTRAILRVDDENDLTRTLTARLLESGLYADARITRPSDALLEHGPAKGRIALPIVLQQETIAVLELRTPAGSPVEAGELEQLQALAVDVSLALEKLRADGQRQTITMSEKKLRDTFEHAGVGITRIDPDGHFIEVNQKFCDMLGYSREELIGRATRDVTMPEDYGSGPAFRKNARPGDGAVLTGEKRYLRKDGSPIWVRRTTSAVFDEQGRVYESISVVEDITERKQAEEAVTSERTLLRTIVDALPHFIYVKDHTGRITLANKAWLEGRGLTNAQVFGKTAFDIFPAAIAQQMEAQDRRVLESGTPLDVEQQVIAPAHERKAKGERWASTVKVPLHDTNGTIIGLVGISRDITARRRMERERAMEHVVARVLSESRNVEETMLELLRTICDAMGWAYGARWMWSAESGKLHRCEWWCEFEPEFEAVDREYWLELGTQEAGGLVRTAWFDQRPTWLTDIASLEGFRRKLSCEKFGFRSAYAFPIVADEERLGVMEFFGRTVREPDDALLEVSGALASQIGQFIKRKQAEESLQENEQQLRAMFENADVGIAVTALDLRYLRVNDKYCNIVGYTREELLEMRVSDVNLEENIGSMIELRDRMVRGELPSATTEKEQRRKDGSLVWVSLATSLVRASDGAPRYFIAVIQDISEARHAAAALKESEEQFRQLAHYDILTQLPNRALFYDRLAHGLAQAKRNKLTLAVMFIDVDRFKNVNDTFGHAAGDLLLKQVADRLSGCVRGEDTVGRLSGDEFAIVLSRLTAPQDAVTVAQKIVDLLNRPFQLEGAELFVTASIGITLYPNDSTEREDLIRNADVAMYRAKSRGRNNFQFYTPEMNTRTREMLNMEGELRRALEREEFVLHYQPKVSLASGKVTGVEALLRWHHPERGLVSPGEFMPLLEETGLVVPVGDWVLREVCRQLNEWQHAGVRRVPIAINLSARQFLAPGLADTFRDTLEQSGVSAELVEVEITESSIMTDPAEATRTLQYLDSLGLKIAIDDFGTGYSSLGYLKRFPLCALKVDQSFVRDITTDADDAAITQAVISMAHSLGLKVIAEGVETQAQLEFLAKYGCDEIQGYLFSRPVPNTAYAEIIEKSLEPARARGIRQRKGLRARADNT
ncbi:MAG TPA: EAL domain-containing protein [Burkholderiales bacterium]|nr:EAL domain-containing protein [Burkholderiales bacterium]